MAAGRQEKKNLRALKDKAEKEKQARQRESLEHTVLTVHRQNVNWKIESRELSKT